MPFLCHVHCDIVFKAEVVNEALLVMNTVTHQSREGMYQSGP